MVWYSLIGQIYFVWVIQFVNRIHQFVVYSLYLQILCWDNTYYKLIWMMNEIKTIGNGFGE